MINPNSRKPKWLRYYYLFKIKRSDAFNNASMGTDMDKGAYFASPPFLYHGLLLPKIGDNYFIGAGARILSNVTIGNNVKIGANAVVTKDIPSNCTVVGIPAKIIINNSINESDDKSFVL